jgi:capsular exopolysaccharide synthesis family protein
MDQNSNDIDVRKIVRVVLEHWWWFVVGIVVCLSIGMIRYFRKTPKWTTEASVVLRQKEGMGGQMEAFALLGLSGNQAAEDEVVVLSSRGIVYQAIDALNLWDESLVKSGLRWYGDFPSPAMTIDYISLTEEAKVEPFTVTVSVSDDGYCVKTKRGRFNKSTTRVADLLQPIETEVGTIRIRANRPLSADTTYRVCHAPKEVVVEQYRNNLHVAQHKKESNIINLSTTSTVPDRDKAFLYQLIEQYNMNAVVDKNMIATNTASFINDRLNIITAELIAAEEAVSTYKTQNNIADLATQAQLFLEASSKEQQAIAEVETQLSLVDYIEEFLRDDAKRHNLIPSNIGITDESVSEGLAEYNALQLQRMRIQRTATEDNPVIEQMNAQLISMRQNIIATIASVRESLLIRQQGLIAQDKKFNQRIKEAPHQEREYIRVLRQQKIKEELYLFLYEKREENALMLAATAMPAKVLDIPQRDLKSQSPKFKSLILLCLFLGICIPAGILYVYMFFNNKINDVKEFEQRIKAPMLGQLVRNSRNTHIAIHEGETSVSAELFRLIRTNLRFMLPAEVKSPVILVTSCINGDGKSYVSSNIALSLAILGKKVALVGLDIRKPMLAQYFNLSNKGHLTDYLAEPDVQIEDIIIPSGEHANLDLLPCGVIPPNPSELLQTSRLDELFIALRERYDYVIVDTAPVALVSDTYLLDRIADMTIFVCRYKYTPAEMVNYVNSVVEQKRMKNVACVLNAVKGSQAGYGYGYGYGVKGK